MRSTAAVLSSKLIVRSARQPSTMTLRHPVSSFQDAIRELEWPQSQADAQTEAFDVVSCWVHGRANRSLAGLSQMVKLEKVDGS